MSVADGSCGQDHLPKQLLDGVCLLFSQCYLGMHALQLLPIDSSGVP